MQTSTASGSTNSHTNGKTLVDLEKLAQEHTAGSMNSLDEFAKYWNEFDGIARGLVETKVISKVERDLLFWNNLSRAGGRVERPTFELSEIQLSCCTPT
ncbi:hypothetical protein NP233_g5048 [Leucocoprinus birnbaumii]|uniref:Uncharacterized protein n=1 Tax=Leucocoprinus birnbaumii TaxID=56174 RepID=A0AAD5YUY7_9AGAR|nr:hypothetical protein NP233_g5048 [Leucocoprinus birnbaumii]